jgi:hypothetical protein
VVRGERDVELPTLRADCRDRHQPFIATIKPVILGSLIDQTLEFYPKRLSAMVLCQFGSQ